MCDVGAFEVQPQDREVVMRYLLILLAMTLAGLGTSPPRANGQDGEEGATSEPKLQGSAPLSEPAFEEAALQFQLDSAGVVFTLATNKRSRKWSFV